MIISLERAKKMTANYQQVYATIINFDNGCEVKIKVTKIGRVYMNNIYGTRCSHEISNVIRWEA